MKINKINILTNKDDIETEIPLEDIKEKLNNFEVIIIKNCLDKEKLVEIREASYNFSLANESENPGNTSKFIKKSFHRIDNNVPAMKKKCIDHLYKFSLVDCPSKYYFEIVERINDFRNKLFGLKLNDFVKDEKDKGIISRPVIKQYPVGGGYMCAHTDTSDPAPLQLLIPMSTKGVGFKSGGLEVLCPKENKWFSLEDEFSIGDVVIHRPDLMQKVSPIDVDCDLNWKSISGKWTLVAILDRII